MEKKHEKVDESLNDYQALKLSTVNEGKIPEVYQMDVEHDVGVDPLEDTRVLDERWTLQTDLIEKEIEKQYGKKAKKKRKHVSIRPEDDVLKLRGNQLMFQKE